MKIFLIILGVSVSLVSLFTTLVVLASIRVGTKSERNDKEERNNGS